MISRGFATWIITFYSVACVLVAYLGRSPVSYTFAERFDDFFASVIQIASTWGAA